MIVYFGTAQPSDCTCEKFLSHGVPWVRGALRRWRWICGGLDGVPSLRMRWTSTAVAGGRRTPDVMIDQMRVEGEDGARPETLYCVDIKDPSDLGTTVELPLPDPRCKSSCSRQHRRRQSQSPSVENLRNRANDVWNTLRRDACQPQRWRFVQPRRVDGDGCSEQPMP